MPHHQLPPSCAQAHALAPCMLARFHKIHMAAARNPSLAPHWGEAEALAGREKTSRNRTGFVLLVLLLLGISPSWPKAAAARSPHHVCQGGCAQTHKCRETSTEQPHRTQTRGMLQHYVCVLYLASCFVPLPQHDRKRPACCAALCVCVSHQLRSWQRRTRVRRPTGWLNGWLSCVFAEHQRYLPPG